MAKPRLGCTVLVVTILTFLGGLLFWMARDEALPDVSDLIIEWQEVSEHGNGVIVLDAASLKFWRPDDDAEQQRLIDSQYSYEWHPEAVERYVKKNAPVLKLLQEALERRHFRVPLADEFDPVLGYLRAWMDLAGLLSLHARHLSRTGRHEEAWEAGSRLAELGQRMQGSGGSTVHFSIGMLPSQSAVEALQKVVQKADWDDRHRPSPRHASAASGSSSITRAPRAA